MLCHAMRRLCYAMLCYAMLCYAMQEDHDDRGSGDEETDESEDEARRHNLTRMHPPYPSLRTRRAT